MSCTIRAEDAFGPAVAPECLDGFDFTLLFEESFFSIGVCSAMLLSLPVQLARLSHQHNRHQQAPAGPLLYSKLTAHLVSTGIKLVLVALVLVPGRALATRATVAAVSIAAATSASVAVLSYWQHRRSPRPSTPVSLFLGLSLLLDAVRARTLWAVQPRVFCAVFIAGIVSDLAKFVLELLGRRDDGSDGPGRLPAETVANVYNRSVFWWLNPLLLQGFREILQAEELSAIDQRLRGGEDSFLGQWEAAKVKSPAALVRLLAAHHLWAALAAVIPRLCLTGLTFTQPFLLARIVRYVTEEAADDDDGLASRYGYGLIAAALLIYIGLAVATTNTQHKTYRLITMLRSSLVPLIYTQTLHLDTSAVRDSAALTLMSVDIERISSGLRYFHEIWASPIDIGLALWLLQQQLGVAAVAPAAIFLVCTLSGLLVAASMGARQRQWLEAIQNRVHATSSMLKNIKEIRLGGLQSHAAKKLQELRSKEISESRPFKKALVMIVTLSFTTAATGPLLAFTMYTLLALRNGSQVLDYEKAYTSLSLLALLQTPMALVLDAIAGFVAAFGAVERIGEYASKPATNASKASSAEMIPLSIPTRPDTYEEKRKEVFVRAQGFSAGWNADLPFVIKNLDFEILRSTVTFIVGPVGCGKSTLLHSILGEVMHTNGSLQKSVTRVGYCCQEPWITNDTVRDNIIGSNLFQPTWYDQVIDACVLRDDLQGFPCGDQWIVGSGGMALSGGQKARLGIARALYSRETLVLLDDIFSGLDAKTEELIFHNLFGEHGILARENITIVLATNAAVNRLNYADNAIYLDATGNKVSKNDALEKESSGGVTLAAPSEKRTSAGQSHENHIGATPELSSARPLTASPQEKERRVGDTTVYKYYIQVVHFMSAAFFAAVCVVFVLGLTLPHFVIKWWLQRDTEYTISHIELYLGIYAGLAGMAIVSLAVAAWYLTEHMLPRASRQFHEGLLSTVVDAPLQFFLSIDMGTTINRFAQDLQLADMELPLALFNTTVELITCLVQLIIIAVASKYIGAAIPVILTVFYLIQKFYLRTARQLRLLDIEAKAPLFSKFLETLSGLVTIRAFGWQKDYEHHNNQALNDSQKPFYLLFCVQRWLNLVLDLVVAAIAVIVVSIAVRTKGKVDAGSTGIALVNIVQFSTTIKSLMANWTQLEISIGAVSRIRSFSTDTLSSRPRERSPELKDETTEPTISPSWPEHGTIEFRGVTAEYEINSTPVIKNLNLSIHKGEKIALCGKSGSGKSSVISALFRILHISEGNIIIDGLDISAIPQEILYTRLVCVTQTPYLIQGTVRENVDPFGTSSDEQVNQVLKEVTLWDTVVARGGIEVQLSDELFSVGQKQLLCLARAMLRPGSILLLDEVSSSVDLHTNKLMQSIIRKHFATRTVITIAHQIFTILDADRVAVISNGEIVEEGQPTELLEKDPPGPFRILAAANMNL
ncbi:multidrug resistance protein [Trichophyton violaceum]|uniref:Multidrug resistance protein n=1 Tax=Trichophyton violaceum TaxID=34388 RepID=A0A178FDG9_TRIVO|nr:multidrug resistance protein [Trichophyton violaceum]